MPALLGRLANFRSTVEEVVKKGNYKNVDKETLQEAQKMRKQLREHIDDYCLGRTTETLASNRYFF